MTETTRRVILVWIYTIALLEKHEYFENIQKYVFIKNYTITSILQDDYYILSSITDLNECFTYVLPKRSISKALEHGIFGVFFL